MIFSHVGQTKPISSKRILYIFDYTCLYLYTETIKFPIGVFLLLLLKLKDDICAQQPSVGVQSPSAIVFIWKQGAIAAIFTRQYPSSSFSPSVCPASRSFPYLRPCSGIWWRRHRWCVVRRSSEAADHEWSLTYTCKTRSRKHARREWKRNEQYRCPFWSRYTMKPALNRIRTTITWTLVSVMNNTAREQEDKIIILTQYSSSTCRYKINS